MKNKREFDIGYLGGSAAGLLVMAFVFYIAKSDPLVMIIGIILGIFLFGWAVIKIFKLK